MEEARVLKKVAQKYQIPFVINDNVAIAKEVDADGVHVGQGDMELKKAREILGPDKIIGVSAHNVEEAVLAEKKRRRLSRCRGISRGTKEEAKVVDRETYQAIRIAVSIPVVAIGGISLENIGELKGYGVDGVALVSAIFASRDIEGGMVHVSGKKWKRLLDKMMMWH
ncbi:MAG: thiamine phosphate synthase [Eubacterium sp.]